MSQNLNLTDAFVKIDLNHVYIHILVFTCFREVNCNGNEVNLGIKVSELILFDTKLSPYCSRLAHQFGLSCRRQRVWQRKRRVQTLSTIPHPGF